MVGLEEEFVAVILDHVEFYFPSIIMPAAKSSQAVFQSDLLVIRGSQSPPAPTKDKARIYVFVCCMLLPLPWGT